MYHYLYTNDMRVSTLEEKSKLFADMFLSDSLPSAQENKSVNNNGNTIGFYLNFIRKGNSAKVASNGNIRKVILNFIKTFQFPNPRTNDSYSKAKEDGILLAPLREIVGILFLLTQINEDEAYLTKDEILDFIFYNDDIAKTKAVNRVKVIYDIIEHRTDGVKKPSIAQKDDRHWNHEDRQINELLSVLEWSEFIVIKENKIRLNILDSEDQEYKSDLLDIITFSEYWNDDIASTDFKELRESYFLYVDSHIEYEQEVDNSIIENRQKEYETYLLNESGLSSSSVPNYIRAIKKENIKKLDGYKNETNIYKISNPLQFAEVYKEMKESPNFESLNDAIGNRALNASLKKYLEFLYWNENNKKISISVLIDKPHQRIFFGAPGTGKSFNLNEEAKEYFERNYERVTFHPNYMYGNFVGAFKPFPKILRDQEGKPLKDENGNIKETITYEYVPGPLMRILVKALINRETNYLILIEEINRANVAAVFGDFFQLLDRQADGESEYPITTSEEVRIYLDMEFSHINDEDIKTYISDKIGSEYERLVLPSNLYIWSTMNSADQGVMPMDTAFKRRWDFTYIGIDDALDDPKIAAEFENYRFKISKDSTVKWNDFRTEVNKRLSRHGVPEDKLLGPYFISKSVLESEDIDKLTDTIKNKVLMYLYDDAGKPYRNNLFIAEKSSTYSALCRSFEENGKAIFKKPLEIEDRDILENISDEDDEI